MHTELAREARPPITLTHTEAETLWGLALASQDKAPLTARLLLEELERAETYAEGCLPPHIATMGSMVAFLDEATGERHEVQLVYPGEADNAQHRISIMTPIGAALIGLARGTSIDWRNRAGEFRRLRILEVSHPPARA